MDMARAVCRRGVGEAVDREQRKHSERSRSRAEEGNTPVRAACRNSGL